MIAVRVPDEIRKYKEKILLGLNARQLLCTIGTCITCVPLYFYGMKYLPENIVSWMIILIAVPLLSIGYITYNGMPMEKFAIAWFKYEILYPKKRIFKTENAFREWQNIAIKEEQPKSYLEKRRNNKIRYIQSLEKSALLYEAEQAGRLMEFNLEEQTLFNMSKKGKKQIHEIINEQTEQEGK